MLEGILVKAEAKSITSDSLLLPLPVGGFYLLALFESCVDG